MTEQNEALRLADRLDLYATGDKHQKDIEDAASELRRLDAELMRKSDAIQRLWAERDSLRASMAHCDRCGKRLGGEGDIHTCTPKADPIGDAQDRLIAEMAAQPEQKWQYGTPLLNLFTKQPEQEPVAIDWDTKTDTPIMGYTTPPAAQQEPVAWMTINAYGEEDDIHYENPEGHLLEGWTYRPLYTHPLSVQPQPVKLRRGDILRCTETDELCTVWSTSTTGKTLVKWNANDFGSYTAEQIGELFWLEPKLEQEPVAWLGFNPRTGAPEFACEKPAPSVMRDYNMKPLVYTNTTPPAAQPEQGPVGSFLTREQAIEFCRRRRPSIEPTEQNITATIDAYAALFGDLVPAPPAAQRTWVGLTDDEISHMWRNSPPASHDFARAIEAKLKELNT